MKKQFDYSVVKNEVNMAAVENQLKNIGIMTEEQFDTIIDMLIAKDDIKDAKMMFVVKVIAFGHEDEFKTTDLLYVANFGGVDIKAVEDFNNNFISLCTEVSDRLDTLLAGDIEKAAYNFRQSVGDDYLNIITHSDICLDQGIGETCKDAIENYVYRYGVLEELVESMSYFLEHREVPSSFLNVCYNIYQLELWCAKQVNYERYCKCTLFNCDELYITCEDDIEDEFNIIVNNCNTTNDNIDDVVDTIKYKNILSEEEKHYEETV